MRTYPLPACQGLAALLVWMALGCSPAGDPLEPTKAAPPSPQTAASRSAVAQASDAVAPASDAIAPETRTYRDPEGLFTLELPAGWESQRGGFGNLAAQPVGEASAEAVLMVSFDELTLEQRGRTASQLIEAAEGDLRELFELQGVSGWRALGPARDAEGPLNGGAFKIYSARGPLGAMTLWVGTRVVREHSWSLLGVLSGPRREHFQGLIEACFHSLRPIEPVRDAGLERDLGGAEFADSSHFDGGAIHTVYTFGAQGAVSRRTMVSGGFGLGGSVGSDAAQQGSFRAFNGHLVLSFPDGTETASIERRNAQVQALLFGERRFARR